MTVIAINEFNVLYHIHITVELMVLCIPVGIGTLEKIREMPLGNL